MACLESSGPHPAILAAVESLGFRCTAGEVALNSGLSVAAAEDELNALLVRGAGSFAVAGEAGSEAGERVVYTFPPDLRARARRQRRAAQALDVWDRVAPWCLFALRFALGVFIFASLAIIALAAVVVAVAAVAAMANSGGGGRGHQQLECGGWNINRLQGKLQRFIGMWNQIVCLYMCFGGRNPFFIPPFFDPLYWGYAYGFFGYGGAFRRPSFGQGGFHRRGAWLQPWRPREETEAGSGAPTVVGKSTSSADHNPAQLVGGRIVREGRRPAPPHQDPAAASGAEGGNVVEAIFSFLFGDGPPQPGAVERWRFVARAIRREGGVVSAQALAPYLEEPPPVPDAVNGETNRAYEAAAAPVVEHFRGRPVHVPGTGLLVYSFGELLGDRAARTLGLEADSGHGALPRSLSEGEWVFSRHTPWELGAVAALGGLNLAGALWFRVAAMRGGSLARVIGPRAALALSALARFVLLPYALLFLCVPALRVATQAAANRGVRARNEAREAHAGLVDSAASEPGSVLQAKDQHARALRRAPPRPARGPGSADTV